MPLTCSTAPAILGKTHVDPGKVWVRRAEYLDVAWVEDMDSRPLPLQARLELVPRVHAVNQKLRDVLYSSPVG